MTVSVAQAQMFFLAATRILAIIIHVPMLAGPLVPTPVRVGLGLLLTIVLLPWQPLPPEAVPMPLIAFGVAIARELVIGTMAGYAAILTFGSLQIAGELMGTSSGFAASRILNPAMENTGSAMDQFFIMMAMVLFMVINGHHLFLIGLQRCFVVLPVNAPLPTLSLENFVHLTVQLIVVGVQLSLPVVGALLLTDLTLGLLARVAPQIQVFFLGLPLKIALGLVVLSMSLGIVFPILSDLFRSLGVRMLQLIGA